MPALPTRALPAFGFALPLRRHARPFLLGAIATAAALSLTWVVLQQSSPLLAHTPFVLLFAAVYITVRWGSESAAHLVVVAEASGTVWLLPAPVFPSSSILAFVFVSIVAVHVIADGRRASERLHTSEAQLRATWDHAAFGAALLERRGRIERINPALVRLLGTTNDACLGASFDSFTHPDDLRAERDQFDALMAGADTFYQREQRYLQSDGTSLWGRVTVSAIADASHPAGALLLLEDITARYQAEADLRVSEEKLRHAQKMEAVGQLVAGVAHNFNNLLTITSGYTDLLVERHRDSPEDLAELEQIRAAADRGAALTRQLLTFSRRQDASPALIDLNRSMAGLREVLTQVVREDITLSIEVTTPRATILMDEYDLQQVLVNLVANARDALPSGGAIGIDVDLIAADPRMIPPDLPVTAAEYVRLRVRDNGAGMTPDVQAHLFEPFFTTKEVGKGTGLGLAYVYGVIRLHHGFIVVDSTPGLGTTFNLCLPLADESASASVGTTVAPPPPLRQSDGTILLVEDEASVRAVTTRMLERAGYQVLAAALPSEAIQLFDRHAGDIDLLLTDVVMPEMHGTELAEQLVALRPDLRVLFVSGYTAIPPAVSGRSGDSMFLGKPFTPSVLVAKVAELLEQPRQPA